MNQSRAASFIEAVANAVIGYAINLVVQLLVYPMFGAAFTFGQNIEIGLIFLVVSIARSYGLRRFFNARLHGFAVTLAQKLGGQSNGSKS